MIYPPRPSPGDRVAVVSPSAGLPQVFPEVYELGLRRLREELDLVPVEYPTTRVLGTPPKDRARDLHAAFADPSITAVLATIGGDDQITVLRHLDSALLQANPKPFFGYSDNTNLLNHLWSLGIVGYHGGSVMVHLGRCGRTRAGTGSTPTGWLRAAPGAATWRSSRGCSRPASSHRMTPSTAACCSWRPPKRCPRRSRCTGSCATWASAASCNGSRRCSLGARRRGTSTAAPIRRRSRSTSGNNARRCCAR